MRMIMLILLLCLNHVSIGQALGGGSASVAPVGFDYARDFRAILEKTKDRANDLYYQKLLVRFLDNDSSLTRAEVLALMIGYTEDPHFKPFKDMEKEKEIFDLNENGDYETALEDSKTYLQTHPVSLRILKERSFSYHQLKKADSAKYFMNLVDKVMGAMIYSGKGKTMETPIFSLGLADGEYFIPNIGMTVTAKNTVWNKHRHFLEVVTGMNDLGEHKNYYFVIQHAKDKIDDDEVNDAPVKKFKKSSKKGKKENKTEKAVTDSLPAVPSN